MNALPAASPSSPVRRHVVHQSVPKAAPALAARVHHDKRSSVHGRSTIPGECQTALAGETGTSSALGPSRRRRPVERDDDSSDGQSPDPDPDHINSGRHGGGPATETVTSEARGRLRPPSLGRSDQAAAARSPGRRIRGSSGGAEPLGWIWIILPRTDPTEQQPGDSSWSESRQPPPSSVQSLCSSGGRPEPDLTQNMATAGNEEPARRYEFKVRSPNQDGPPDRS